MKKSVLCLAVILVAATAPASASETGFYLGAGLGPSSIDIKAFYPSLGDSTIQDGTAYKAFGGFRFLKFLAIEAGYADLGSPQGIERNVQEHPERVEVSVKGWDAFAVLIIPVSNGVDIFGKIGMMSWDTNITSVQDNELNYAESFSGTDTAYGIGIGFWVGMGFTIRGEGEWFTIGDFETVAIYTANLIFTF